MPTYHRLILVAALCLTPVWASAKTEITWMQYLHGIHYFKYHGKYNPGFDYSCRFGQLTHPISNYLDVPKPSRQTQGWRWYTPTINKSWSPSSVVTIENIDTDNQYYQLMLNPNHSVRRIAHGSGGPAWVVPRHMKCVPFAVVPGGVTDPRSGVYGPDPGWHFYRLGPCQGAGHRGEAYEAQGRSKTHIYCVDHQYILYSFYLVNQKFWQAHRKELKKFAPKLIPLLAYNISTFFALDKIGGVKVQIPPSWWRPAGMLCMKNDRTTVCVPH